MEHRDQFGYPVSLGGGSDGAAALAAWDRAVLAFLRHGCEAPEFLQAALERAPDFVMARACRGLFCLLLARREMVETARGELAAARAACRQAGCTRREHAYLAALEHWLEGRAMAAADTLDSALAAAPADALALKLVHAIRFMHGDNHGMRASLERVIGAYDPDHPAYGYVHGCHAFALEETGDYALAERTGRRAVEHAPDDAWGVHAVAHVHEMTGATAAGIAWLSGHPKAWSHCNNFRHHMWWHLALMRLERGEIDAVLTLYDTRIRDERTDDYRDISNAASLLGRLELAGVDVGERWEELAAISAGRMDDDCLVFADLHYMLALVGGNRADAMQTLLARLEKSAARGTSDMDRVAAEAGLPGAAGLAAFQAGDFSGAYRNLSRARLTLQSIGGSHAQRDVFEQVMIEAAMRSGHVTEARRLLDARLKRRAGNDAFAARRIKLLDGGRREQARELAATGT